MKVNVDKCHLLIITNEKRNIPVGGVKLQNIQNEKLLGVTIDNKLSFTKHVNKICVKANQKFIAFIIYFYELR